MNFRLYFKTLLLIALLMLTSLSASAQDSAFHGKINNSEYNVFIQMNLYEESVIIPGQDILGKVYGYLKKNTDSRVWIIMAVEWAEDGKSAVLEMINDYGSEDLTAMLTLNSDGSYTLKQMDGSTIKVAGKNKWIKLPKELRFVR